MKPVDRRKFLGTLGAASAFTIVPRRVLGGPRLHPAERHDPARAGRLRHAVAAPGEHRVRAARPTCSSSRSSIRTATAQNYVDWEQFGNRTRIRQFLEEPAVGRGRHRHPRRPRRRAPDHGDLLQEAEPPGGRHPRLRGLPRDAREGNRHPGHRQHHAGSPARQHQHRGAEEGQGRDRAQAGRAAAATKLRRTLEVSRAEHGAVRICSPTATRRIATRWRHGSTAGVIGTVREVHNWTNRPFWPQGWQEYYKSGPPVPDGFNWALWQGPEPDRPYHPNYTFCLYRGWYAYGAGCLGDMGLYAVAAVPHPRARRARDRSRRGRTTTPRSNEKQRQRRAASCRSRPSEGQHHPLAPSRDGDAARRSTRSGTTAARSRRRRRSCTRTRRTSPTRACCSSATRARSSATSARTSRA